MLCYDASLGQYGGRSCQGAARAGKEEELGVQWANEASRRYDFTDK